MNVYIACKTGSEWVETFASLPISYSIFKLSTTLLKKELQVSASWSLLVIVFSVFLLVTEMPFLKIVGLFSYYRSKSYHLDQQSNFFWLYVEELHKDFVAYCIFA